jgi:hypothetical protein
MVRRWSYINSINAFYNQGYDSKRHAAFGVTVKATMYFRKPYSAHTVLSRRRWARRKHLFGWLALSNVIKTWAQTYRFQRNHLKSSSRAHFSKSSFLAFNTISLRNSLPSKHQGAELVIFSSVTRKILRYFSALSNPRVRSLMSFKNINLAMVSFPDPSVRFDDTPAASNLVLVTQDNLTSFTSSSGNASGSQLSHLAVFQAMVLTPLLLTLRKVKLIYRVLILLTLKRT